MSEMSSENRKMEIVKIQIARKQLNLPDDQYYAILSAQGDGAASSKELNHEGCYRVLAYLERLGWKSRIKLADATRRPKRPTPSVDVLPLVRRIRAQLISLDHLPDSYADGISKQMYGVEFYEWCKHDQLHAITAALAVQQRNRGAATR